MEAVLAPGPAVCVKVYVWIKGDLYPECVSFRHATGPLLPWRMGVARWGETRGSRVGSRAGAG